MKTSKDYLSEMQMDDSILFNRHENSIWISDFIEEVQKESYNNAIEDAINSITLEQSGIADFYSKQYQELILKLKIK